MQNGRTIYYSGNTINRGVSQQSIRKRIEQTEVVKPMTVIMPIIDKVFATSQCIWCNRQLGDYHIRCRFCKNCQYCGMAALSDESCQNCGNHIDDELRRERTERQTIIFGQ